MSARGLNLTVELFVFVDLELVVDQLLRASLCDPKLLETALTLWRDDKAVFLPNQLIDNLLRRVR